MTIEDAIKKLKTHPLAMQEWESEYYKDMSKAFKLAINSLEAWEKVKLEINNLPIEYSSSVFECLHIIDKCLEVVENGEQ